MKTWLVRVLPVLVLILAVAALADAANTERFGMAGCGLGSLIFGDSPGKVEQVLASTTNGTFGNQTFGISSGTSNCNPKAGPAGAKLYIETNREALAKDVSRGTGETLAGLSALAGCRDAGAVGRTLQKNFRAIFPEAGIPDAQVSSSILGILSSDTDLACQELI